MYHSFPRRGKGEVEKGLKILESIAERGLLLTPELVNWPGEIKANGRRGHPVTAYQKRVCFTNLRRDELPTHAETFGKFALEFDVSTLRGLGAVPVFYVPVSAEEDAGLSGVGAAFVSRLADWQATLERLQEMLQFSQVVASQGDGLIGAKDDPATGDLLLLTTTPGPELRFPKKMLEEIAADNPAFSRPKLPEGGASLGSTGSGWTNLLTMLTWNLQSLEVQVNSFRAMCGLFYPTERIAHQQEPLTYYRQREWRVLGSMTKNGAPVSEPLIKAEIELLLGLDNSFYSRELDLRLGKKRMADECQMLRQVGGRPILAHAQRVICPREAFTATRDIVRRVGIDESVIEIL